MKQRKKNCTMNVYSIEGLEGLTPPSFAQNKRIALLGDIKENSQDFQSVLLLAGKSINHVILPYFNDDVESDNPENNNEKNIQNKPIRKLTSSSPHPLSHKFEVTSLSGPLHSLILNKEKEGGYVTDEFGNLAALTFDRNFNSIATSFTLPAPFPSLPSFSQPSLLPSSSYIGVISEYGKWFYLADGARGEITRRFFTIQPPTAIAPLSPHTLALTEFNQVSIWDERDPRGCIHRLFASDDWLYCLANGGGEVLCAAGASRTVQSIDTRKWQMIERWQNCTKYEINDLQISNRDPSLLFVSGLDGELVCDKWSGKKSQSNHTKSFRGDGCWSGFSMHEEEDLLAGFNSNGRVYIFNNASSIYPSLQ